MKQKLKHMQKNSKKYDFKDKLIMDKLVTRLMHVSLSCKKKVVKRIIKVLNIIKLGFATMAEAPPSELRRVS